MRGPSKVMLMLLVVALIAVPGALRAQQGAGSAGSTGGTATRPGAVSRAGVVSGTVYDSVAGAPLAGAVVQLLAEQPGADSGASLGSGVAQRVYTTTSDATGHYQLLHVPAGSYLATVFHPAFGALGLEPVLHRVQVDDEPITRVDLGVPSPGTIWRAACGPIARGDSSGLLVGQVHDADTAIPIAGSTVTVTWTELVLDQQGLHSRQRQVATETDQTGRYALCGISTDGPVGARATRGAAATGLVALRVAPQGLLHRDFGLGRAEAAIIVSVNADTVADTDSAGVDASQPRVVRRGTARLAGGVRSAEGKPLADVLVAVRGTRSQAMTDQQGGFLLTDLPSGTYTLEARRLGFAPARTIVDLVSDRTTRVVVMVDRSVPVLDAVHVFGKDASTRNLRGFFARRARGFGHFLTRAEIELKHPVETTDLFRQMPEVHVRRRGRFNHTVATRRRVGNTKYDACPAVFVDGLRLHASANAELDNLISTYDIAALEVYPTGESPPEFIGDNCGSIVVWTRPRSTRE